MINESLINRLTNEDVREALNSLSMPGHDELSHTCGNIWNKVKYMTWILDLLMQIGSVRRDIWAMSVKYRPDSGRIAHSDQPAGTGN